jgi:hypothetical protein
MATRELKDALEQASTTEYGVAKLAAHAGTTAGTAVQADDARLTAAADLATHEAATAAHGATGAVVGTTNSQTLTNKTLTSPAINTPTGIVKGDVGLGNVDNTSDATKNAAAVTLTNKTLTTPTIGSFTNATHTHQNAAGGGTLDAAAIASGVLAVARLATGTPDGTKFVRDDGTLAVPSGSGMSNPMTTAGDLIVGGASGTPARLAKGSDGQVLTVDPTTHLLVWATPSGGGSALTVEEVDASPTDSAVTKIVFPNGTLGIASHVATYIPGRKYYTLPRGWRDAWDTAKAAVGATPARVAIMGDSFFQGRGSSNYQTKGSQNLLASAIKAAYGDGADFWMTSDSADFESAYTGTPPWVKGSLALGYNSQGFGRTAFNSGSPTGTVWTFTTPYACTDIDILYYRYNTTAGTWKYTVDGGADQTVTPANQGKVTRIALTGLANTTHTLVFKDPSAATTMGVVGVVTYKTKGTNVYVARCGWSGARIGHLFDPSTPLIDPNSQADSARRLGTLYWRGDSTATGDTDFPARPHLAIAAIGLNDNLNSVVSEDYFDAVTRLVRGLRRGVKDCSILLVAHNYPDTENTDSNDPSSRGAYWRC